MFVAKSDKQVLLNLFLIKILFLLYKNKNNLDLNQKKHKKI